MAIDTNARLHKPWLPDWYVKRFQQLDRVHKLKLEKRLIYGYTAFGVCFGLLQYTGMGSLPPAMWLSEWVEIFIPMIELAGRASPNPDGTRFFYSVMWLLALANVLILTPLCIDLHHEEMPSRIKKYPVGLFLFVPFFSFCVTVIYIGGTNEADSLGNWKLYSNYLSMALYGSCVMTVIPFFIASAALIIQFWREIVEVFVGYLFRRGER